MLDAIKDVFCDTCANGLYCFLSNMLPLNSNACSHLIKMPVNTLYVAQGSLRTMEYTSNANPLVKALPVIYLQKINPSFMNKY